MSTTRTNCPAITRLLPSSLILSANVISPTNEKSKKTFLLKLQRVVLKDAAKKELTSGRGPTGVAAAAIYIASILCNERRTQREVADIAGVTEVTIRNRYKELTEKLGIEIQL